MGLFEDHSLSHLIVYVQCDYLAIEVHIGFSKLSNSVIMKHFNFLVR